ncbi:hypothetical protein [Psychroflexus sp. ALD_RP9]|uniref:hypothetical protein n=1 Tax=Psychroflexus sp. ALD_RP9 TaxID=2777186 RepID=UPI001A8F9D7F|nr:hypothetical protein [Psychroflexus sp. ALD_RP9]QSS96609.1 hypothetical protein IMZ30_09165 [Psychroflexus sp. ALD_RP9]
MKTIKSQILEKIESIENNEVYKLPDANVEVNAPRALVQVALKNQRQAYLDVLKMLEK